MTAEDPFRLFGLTPDATLGELRSARRRLAFESHPDRGGTDELMKQVNDAFDKAVGHITGRRPIIGSTPEDKPPTPPPRRGNRLQHDGPSFVIGAPMSAAFDALLLVCSWIGEVLMDEAPARLEVQLREPAPCWCCLTLVADAGASVVSLSVAAWGVGNPPDLDAVRDTWVHYLNQPGVFV